MTDFNTRAHMGRLDDEASRPPGVKEIGQGLFPWLVFVAAFGIIALAMRALFGG